MGGAYMLTVLLRLTLQETKNKILLSWFSGTPYTGTRRNRASFSQAGFVSQLVEAYARLLFAQAQLVETY